MTYITLLVFIIFYSVLAMVIYRLHKSIRDIGSLLVIILKSLDTHEFDIMLIKNNSGKINGETSEHFADTGLFNRLKEDAQREKKLLMERLDSFNSLDYIADMVKHNAPVSRCDACKHYDGSGYCLPHLPKFGCTDFEQREQDHKKESDVSK